MVMTRWGNSVTGLRTRRQVGRQGRHQHLQHQNPVLAAVVGTAIARLVQFTSFSESVWYALGEDRPLAFFTSNWAH